MSGTEEQDMKEEMSQRQYPDSLEIAAGTPSKGSATKLKCYFNSADMDEADKKVKGLLQIRQFLIERGIWQ